MRGLLKAGVLLAPALAGAVALEEGESRTTPSVQKVTLADRKQDSIPSAFITLHTPESGESTTSPDLVFRFDIHESNNACGYGNVTINGQNLPEGGSGSLTMNEDLVVDATWNFTCVAWNGEPQEQLLSLNVDYINGQPTEDVGFTLRFQQVAPVWISDIEGSASMTRLHSLGQGESKQPCDGKEEMDLDAEMAELDYLNWQMAELSQLIRVKEIRLAEAFGWERQPGHRYIEECDSLKCVFGAVVHKVKGAAKSAYGFGGRPGPHGPPGPHGGPHGPKPHGHGLEGPHHEDKEPHFPQHPGHNNHTEDGTHPPPPHHGKPDFHHPPPFCKCAPTPPHHGDHRRPPPHGEGHPPPPPGFGPPPHHGEHPPSPPPMSRHHDGPGFFGSLFGFVDPHRPSPPRPWDHMGGDENMRHGHGHGHGHEDGPEPHKGGPHHEDHEDHEDGPKPFMGEPHHEDHEDGPKAYKGEQHSGDNEAKVFEDAKSPEDTPDVEESRESELRRDYEQGPPQGPPPPHDGPFDGPLDGPVPHGPPPPGPPPPGPPPHGPFFFHVASAFVSFILLGVFGSVLYQRYVRKSIRTPHRHRGYYSVPWYKKMCFGPHYSEISEYEEKEAMLRGSDEDSDDEEEGDGDVVARDISQFRTAADVISEMVAVEDERVMAHSRQPSQANSILAPSAAPVAQQQQMQMQMQTAYAPAHVMPTNAIPVPMPMSMSNNVPMTADQATLEAMAAMFPDLHLDEAVDELPAYQEADRASEDETSELASSMVSDGYRPGCSGASYTPSESGSQGADDILGDTKN